MGKELLKIKENKKSVIYENDEYRIQYIEENGVYYKKNDTKYAPYDDEMDDDAYKFIPASKIVVTNKLTEKSAQKRTYQGISVINDFQSDLCGDKSQFAEIFKK